jgi:hypothetical protein
LAETQLNGVSSRKVDDFSVVIHDARVEETAGMLEAAKAAAKPFEDRLQRSIHHLITDDHKREQDLKHACSADILHARATVSDTTYLESRTTCETVISRGSVETRLEPLGPESTPL